MVEKDRSAFVNKTYLLKMLPVFYQSHLQNQLSRAEYLLLTCLISLLQTIKQVRLEALATALPLPITFDSRRRKLQRFISLQQLSFENIWFPILLTWLKADEAPNQVLHIAIDRTSWGAIGDRRRGQALFELSFGANSYLCCIEPALFSRALPRGCINLLMVSWIEDKRAIPIYCQLLPKLGSSNFESQKGIISKILPLLKDYKVVVLGDREFCSVYLGNWLRQQSLYFCLRLKKTEFVYVEGQIWLQLSGLGLAPGTSLYLEGVNVTKQKGFDKFNVAAKWKRKYRGWAPDEGWFILTNLSSLSSAIAAYQKRFDIEEMFRDCKSGGYNLEGTQVSGQRLILLILLITIAYSTATIEGRTIKRMGVQKYVGRVKEPGRTQRRHSSFYIGLYGQTWVNYRGYCAASVEDLMKLNRNKWKYYQKGLRAMELILSAS